MTQEGEWIEWSGGECPVAPDILTDVRFRGGDQRFGFPAISSGQRNWCHNDRGFDIVAYRTAPPVMA